MKVSRKLRRLQLPQAATQFGGSPNPQAGHPEKMANAWEKLAEETIFLIIGNASLLGCCLLYHGKKSCFQLFH
ncbi:hypothetical protein QQ045_015870 [Rhodiola kirilowii]